MSTDRRDTIDAAPPRASLRGLIQRALRKRDLDLRVAAPATVVSYTPATQTAMCTIGFLRVTAADTPAGEVAVPMPPELVEARVAVAQGTTWSDQPPIPIAGDTGLLIFADRALDQWYRSQPIAGITPPVDPALGRTHDQADAIFFPGLSPDARLSTPSLNPLGRTIDAPTIHLGAAAALGTHNVAITALIHTYLVGLVAAMSAGSAAGDGGTAALAAGTAYLGANAHPTMGSATVAVKP